MYGISSKVTSSPEDHFQQAMVFINEASVAIEQLVEIEKRNKNIHNSSQQRIDNNTVKNITYLFGSKIGIEYAALEDNNDDSKSFLRATGDILKKLIAYVRNAVEFAAHAITSHRRTAIGMRDSASVLIGEADTAASDTQSGNIKLSLNSTYVYTELNLRGRVPQDIDVYITKELKLSRALATVDYAEMISALVKGIKDNNVGNEDREKILTELRQSCEKNLTKIELNDSAGVKMDSSCDYYRSEITLGNIFLVVTVPKIIDHFSKYNSTVKTIKKLWKNASGDCKVMNRANILEVTRAIKIYCDEVIRASANQDSINKASREINLAVRKGNKAEVAVLVKDFASLTRNPHLTHTRMALTLCARALRYCRASIDVYNKKSGIK